MKIDENHVVSKRKDPFRLRGGMVQQLREARHLRDEPLLVLLEDHHLVQAAQSAQQQLLAIERPTFNS